MNIWGILFLTVFVLWLFIEYLRYVKYKLIEIAEEYEELRKAHEELEKSTINILNKAYKNQWEEEFESTLIELAGYAIIDLQDASLYTLIKSNIGKIGTKVKIKARKGKIVIEKINKDADNKNIPSLQGNPTIITLGYSKKEIEELNKDKTEIK